jgi:hypothetical protein
MVLSASWIQTLTLKIQCQGLYKCATGQIHSGYKNPIIKKCGKYKQKLTDITLYYFSQTFSHVAYLTIYLTCNLEIMKNFILNPVHVTHNIFFKAQHRLSSKRLPVKIGWFTNIKLV